MDRLRELFRSRDCPNLFEVSGYHQEWQNMFSFIVLMQNILIPKKYIIKLLSFGDRDEEVLLSNSNLEKYYGYLISNPSPWDKEFYDYYLSRDCQNPEKDFRYFLVSSLIYLYGLGFRPNPNQELLREMKEGEYNISFSTHFFYHYQWYLFFSIFSTFNDLPIFNQPLTHCVLESLNNLFQVNVQFLNSTRLPEKERIDISQSLYSLEFIKNPNHFYLDVYREFFWGPPTLSYDIVKNYWYRPEGINIISIGTGNGASEINFILYSILYLKIKINTLYVCDIIYQVGEDNYNKYTSLTCLKRCGLIKHLVFCHNVMDLYQKITSINHLRLAFSPKYGGRDGMKGTTVWLAIKIKSRLPDLDNNRYFEYTYRYLMRENSETLKNMFGQRFKIIGFNGKDNTSGDNEYLYLLSKIPLVGKHYDWTYQHINDNFNLIGEKPKDLVEGSTIQLERVNIFKVTEVLGFKNVLQLITKKTETPLIKFTIYDQEVERGKHRGCGRKFGYGPNSYQSYDFQINL